RHFSLRMIFSDLPTPAEASVHTMALCQGFAQAGNRCPPRINCGAGFFGIMRLWTAGKNPGGNSADRTQPSGHFPIAPKRSEAFTVWTLTARVPLGVQSDSRAA